MKRSEDETRHGVARQTGGGGVCSSGMAFCLLDLPWYTPPIVCLQMPSQRARALRMICCIGMISHAQTYPCRLTRISAIAQWIKMKRRHASDASVTDPRERRPRARAGRFPRVAA